MPRMALLVCIVFLSASSLAQTVDIDEPAHHPTTQVAIRSLVFDDSPGLTAKVAHDAERAVTSRTYGPDYRSAVTEIVRDAFQRDGYFKATVLAPLRFTMVGNHKGKLEVDAHVIAIPGKRYDLGSISFRGDSAFPAATLRQQFPIRDGDVLDIEKLRIGLAAMKELYCTRGYVNFTPVPDFTFNEHDHLAAVLLDIDEGAPYRVGKLMVQGEESPDRARRQLEQAWKKYEGTYTCDPVHQLLSDLHACKGSLEPKVEIQQDNANHLLNYIISVGTPSAPPATCMAR